MAKQITVSTLDVAITRMIADRVRRRGEALASIARTTGVPTSQLARLARAAGIRYKHQHATPDQIRAAMNAVINEGLTFRAAGRKHGMSKTAVHRFVQKRRVKAVDAVGKVKFRREKKAWRCLRHGLVEYHPCVICVAQGFTT
jgi:lambda repressor-like predicted transcriptional regulator